MVMAYIVFVNPSILGYVGVPGLEGKGLPFAATLTVTCLTAGVLSIAMGLASNYPLVLAPGMGLNAVVAFELVAGRGLTWPQAMTVVFLEGAAITLLVLTRFREAVMDAVPLGLKRAIGVGIGLFIAFIGFFTSGFVVKPASGPLPVALGTFGGLPSVVFVVGFILTAWLMARRVRGALLLGIVLTTLLAIVLNGVLASWTGFPTPGAARIPAAIAQPTAPALIIVGFFMMTIARDIPWEDYEEAIPAFVTMLAMPFTWSITNGIGAGFVTYSAIKTLNGKGRQVHWMVHLAAAAFIVYFGLPLIEHAMQ